MWSIPTKNGDGVPMVNVLRRGGSIKKNERRSTDASIVLPFPRAPTGGRMEGQ